MVLKSLILQFLFFLVDKTCVWRYKGHEKFQKLIDSDFPILVCMWHGNFIFPMIYFKRFFPSVKVVSSTHNDSMILATVLKKYGFNLIKGSSSKGAQQVLKKMIREYRRPESLIAITNDGPKGPPRVAKLGSIALAHKMNAHIVFMSGRASRFWKLKTWDGFILPKPFSKNTVYIDKIKIPKELNKEDVAVFLTSQMNKIENDINQNII